MIGQSQLSIEHKRLDDKYTRLVFLCSFFNSLYFEKKICNDTVLKATNLVAFILLVAVKGFTTFNEKVSKNDFYLKPTIVLVMKHSQLPFTQTINNTHLEF